MGEPRLLRRVVLLLVALAPAASPPSLLLVFGLVAAYAIATKVELRSPVGRSCRRSSSVPMLFLLPPALVPIAVAAGFLSGSFPASPPRFHLERVAIVVLSAWHAVGAAAVFAVAGEQEATLSALPVLAAALLGIRREFATTCARRCSPSASPSPPSPGPTAGSSSSTRCSHRSGFSPRSHQRRSGPARSCLSRRCSCSSGSSRWIGRGGSTVRSNSRTPIAGRRSCLATWTRP